MSWIEIGIVTAPHAVAGEVRVRVETDFPDRFAPGASLTLLVGDARTPRTFAVETARPHRGMVLLKLAGVDDRTAAGALRGAPIVVKREEVRKLPAGAYYLFELEGLEVFDVAGRRLGILKEVLQGAGNDVYVVQGEREILLPAVKQVIRSVDLAAGRMVVELMEGL